MSTYVLVHGAWGGSYNWRTVRRLLTAAGHEVYTPSLTGLGERSHLAGPEVNLTMHTQDVVNEIWYEDLTDIILVGHSYGGMVVSGVADRLSERIAHLVFLDAFQPADGQCLFDMGGPPRPSDDWRVPPLSRPEDPTGPEADWQAPRRQPQPRGTFEEPVHLSVPLAERPFSLTYIVATGRSGYHPIFDAAADRLRADPRWSVHEIWGGHSMQRTNPDGLSKLLLELFPTREAVPSGA
jgi:pimeloyl-ACP methyl ester carboxylesterase